MIIKRIQLLIMFSKILPKLFKNNVLKVSRFNNKINTSIRSMRTLNYGNGIPQEIVYERTDYPITKIKNILKTEKLAVIGYGPQGQGQALNLRDNGLPVIIGVRENGQSWNKAIEDGFIPGETLLPIDEAVKNGSIIMNLLSDASQIDVFPKIKENLTPGKTLYFSHGFGVVYKNLTGVNVDDIDGVDVVMVAPKGSGKTVRTHFLNGDGINSSYAIYKDESGNAKDKTLAIGFGIGSPYIYETTFQNEVYSDLTGERSVLMGGIAGLFKAQYDVLREHGHSPSEAFNETVEEALHSLYPLINEKGMDYMFSNCSSTAQRGAIDWSKRFEEVNKPLINEIYNSVKSGKEVERVLEFNSQDDYKSKLDQELQDINNMEIWKVGKEVRKLRPQL